MAMSSLSTCSQLRLSTASVESSFGCPEFSFMTNFNTEFPAHGRICRSMRIHRRTYATTCRAQKDNDATQYRKRDADNESPVISRRLLGAAGAVLTTVAQMIQWTGDSKADGVPLLEKAAEESLLELKTFSNPAHNFTLLTPTNWKQVDKAGATLYIEDPDHRSSTIGVVVNPVRIDSLTEFASLDEVALKLIATERNKQSTKEVTLLKTNSRQASTGEPVYALEYMLDSTRGSKRLLTAVGVHGRKLYILSISYADGAQNPTSVGFRKSMQNILDSFDLTA